MCSDGLTSDFCRGGTADSPKHNLVLEGSEDNKSKFNYSNIQFCHPFNKG